MAVTIGQVVHEWTDGRGRMFYVVGKWNARSGHYERPLDAEERWLTGCHTEFGPLSYLPRYSDRKDAEERARRLFHIK
jgi:hypothetical protein